MGSNFLIGKFVEVGHGIGAQVGFHLGQGNSSEFSDRVRVLNHIQEEEFSPVLACQRYAVLNGLATTVGKINRDQNSLEVNPGGGYWCFEGARLRGGEVGAHGNER